MDQTFYTWEGIYASFPEATLQGPGFDGDTWRERSLKSARESLEALNVGKPIPAFYKQRSTLLPPIVAMMLVSQERISLLDLGGGLGIGYMTLAESIPFDIQRVDYTIIEVDTICESGRQLFTDRPVNYLSALPEHGRYHLVHSSSALQYIEDWKELFRKLASYHPEYIFLSDVFAGSIPTYVTLQNYYGSKIRHWFFNLDELLDFFSSIGYELSMKSFVSSKRLGVDDVLPMDNFPDTHRIQQTLHLLLRRVK